MAKRKLYNGGDRISEKLSYTTKSSAVDFKELNWNAYFLIDAPEADFFEVPDMVPGPDGGQSRLPVYFHEDMAKKHGHKGVILIDEERGTPVDDDAPYAKTEEDAMEKGDRLWLNHLRHVVGEHFQFVADSRAQGQAPKAARFFTRAALKKLGIKDPADDIFGALEVKKVTASERKEAAAVADKLEKQ